MHQGDVKTNMWSDIKHKTGEVGLASWVAMVEQTGARFNTPAVLPRNRVNVHGECGVLSERVTMYGCV